MLRYWSQQFQIGNQEKNVDYFQNVKFITTLFTTTLLVLRPFGGYQHLLIN